MAPPPLHQTGAILFLSLALCLLQLLISSSAHDHDDFLLLPSNGGSRPAMILPLFLTPPNASRTSAASSRRHLQISDPRSAQMYLYDDLLLNGYYTTRLWIGTPPQMFALIVDTGSTVTYVPCSNCEQCGNHQDPKFQPQLSSTYQPVKCNPDCSCDNDREQCVYERQYAEMSTSSGVLGEDVVSFGNLSELSPQRAVFGCENVETGDLYSQHADGIMGLGRGDLSIVDQLVEKGAISDSFSLCYGGMEIGGGAMVLGGISPPSDMVFAYSDAGRSPYYNIDLKEIHVAGKQLPVNPRVFDGKHGTVLDSGTTYAYLPEPAYLAFKDAIMKEVKSVKQIRGPDPNYNDICFSGAGSDISQLSKTFPTVEMVFGTEQKLSLTPENYLFRHSKVRGAYCLGIFQNGKDPTTLLGGLSYCNPSASDGQMLLRRIIVRNTLVSYDREHSKIGFWKTNCSELWERLHLPSASSPRPSSSNETNPAPHISPSQAPAEPTDYNISEFQIGQITFDMSLNISYVNLKPHTTELANSIAHELDLNVSQVHLLNLITKGNNTLTRWAILPESPGDYISNSTAMDLIARLAEHRVQLPDTFGSYQFIEWHVDPTVKRTWWQKNYPSVVLVTIVVLIIGLSASCIWYIWRRRQQMLTAYKPVDATGPEQELQPL